MARLSTRLAFVDQHDGTATCLKVQRDTDTNDAGAKDHHIACMAFFCVAEAQVSCLCSECPPHLVAARSPMSAEGMQSRNARKQKYVD
jgi:hypothetical protein